MAYTLNTNIGDILKDADRIVAILEKSIPMIGMVKAMTLKSLLSLPQVKQAGITEDMVLKVLAQVNAQE